MPGKVLYRSPHFGNASAADFLVARIGQGRNGIPPIVKMGDGQPLNPSTPGPAGPPPSCRRGQGVPTSPLRDEGGAARRRRGLFKRRGRSRRRGLTKGSLMLSRPYNAELLPRARDLRKNATKQENRLWYEFLRKYRPRFTRQRIVGNYILDFYCGKAKLAVELDGLQHSESEAVEYDRIRTIFLISLGIQVIRFTNLDIDQSFERVCTVIDERVCARATPGPAGPPPSCRRGQG